MSAPAVGTMEAVFAPEAQVRQMLRFEAALARAQAESWLIPHEAAARIGAQCDAARFDVPALRREAAVAGTLAIPLVRALTERVGDEYGRFVHWGATSQDVIDTALVLQMRDGLDLLLGDLLRACAACAGLARGHRDTVMAGRTLLQQAVPVTFGLKAARWLALLARQVRELRDRRARSLALQFGGAAGTLAALGESGPLVAERLATELGLALPELPWHAERDRTAAIAAALGIVAGATSKIAGDVVLLAQTEVGEAAEAAAPGKGGSSAMPNKRNPAGAIASAAAARLALGVVPVVLSAMAQEHERAAGAWQAETMAIPELFRHASAAVGGIAAVLGELRVDTGRMRENAGLDGGAIMAESLGMTLAGQVGRPRAQEMVRELIARAARQGITLRSAALADTQVRAVLSHEVVEKALDPGRYLGSTNLFIDRALSDHAALLREVEGR